MTQKKDAKQKVLPKEKVKEIQPLSKENIDNIQKKLPKELLDRLNANRPKLEDFCTKLLERFKEYIVSVALLPPARKRDAQGNPTNDLDLESINVLVLVDDSDSLKMSKEELASKLTSVVDKVASDIDKNIKPDTVLLSELWQNCFDGKDELLQMVALCAPLHDKGVLSSVKLTEIHKQMILKKFERYIVAYVIAGKTVYGDIGAGEDIDLFIVIDDTDVKRMTRAELKDKLRAIIVGMGMEAGEMIGVTNRLNIQVYILTDFWDCLKEANPITYTLLRDGVPMFDRGIFMPWKQLLRMGKIKPSAEAIDLFMSSGDHALKRIRYKLRDIGQEEIYYALLTPSQAALMLYGIPPPAPKETPHLLREIFVKKENCIEEKYIKILDDVIKLRTDLMNGKKKDFTGTEADKLVEDAKTYMKEIGKLFKKLEMTKEKENILNTYDSVITATRDALKSEGIENIDEKEMAKKFEEILVNSNKVPQGLVRTIELVCKAKEDYDSGKLSKEDIEKANKEARIYIKSVVEYVQRKHGRVMERAKLKVKHGDKYGEIIMLDDIVFVIDDISSDKPTIHKANVTPEGSLSEVGKSSFEELEKAISKISIPPKVFLKEPIFEDLKKIFGKDVEVMLG